MTRSRSPRQGRPPAPLLALATAVATALLASLLVAAPSATAAPRPSQDFPRLPAKCATAQEKIPQDPKVCYLNGFKESRPSIMLWGDSHIWMFIPALRKAIRGERVNLVAVMAGSCPPMDNQVTPRSRASKCFRSNAIGIQVARRLERIGKPYRIVLGSSWQRYRHAIKVGDRTSYVGINARAMQKGTPRLVRTLKGIGATVDVVGQAPTVPTRRPRCRAGNQPYACNLKRSRVVPEAAATQQYLRRTMRPLLGSRRIIDVLPTVCGPRICRGVVAGTRTWFDDLHLSASMSMRMSPYFARSVEAVLPRRATESTDSRSSVGGAICLPFVSC